MTYREYHTFQVTSFARAESDRVIQQRTLNLSWFVQYGTQNYLQYFKEYETQGFKRVPFGWFEVPFIASNFLAPQAVSPRTPANLSTWHPKPWKNQGFHQFHTTFSSKKTWFLSSRKLVSCLPLTESKSGAMSSPKSQPSPGVGDVRWAKMKLDLELLGVLPAFADDFLPKMLQPGG